MHAVMVSYRQYQFPQQIYDSNCVPNIYTGVNSVINNKSIKVYPNPNNGKFIIESSEISEQLSVEVYNALGQKVFTSSLNPSNRGTSTTTISVPNGEAGVYLYRVFNQEGEAISSGKLIIQ